MAAGRAAAVAGTLRACGTYTPRAALSRRKRVAYNTVHAFLGGRRPRSRSPEQNATGSFRLRPARTLQGETHYARYRLAC